MGTIAVAPSVIAPETHKEFRVEARRTATTVALVVLAIPPLMALPDGKFTLTIVSVFVLTWLLGPTLRPWIGKISISLFAKFVSLGMAAGVFTEWLVFLDLGIGIHGESGLFSRDLLPDLVLAMGIYVSLIVIWYFLLKRYAFSLPGVFVSAGTWGVVIEQDFAVLLSLDPLAYLYIFAVYGSFVSIPFVLTSDCFDESPRSEGKVKYVVAFFVQFLAYIIGTLWIILLRASGV